MQGGKIGITHTRLCDLDDGVQIIQILHRHYLWYASAASRRRRDSGQSCSYSPERHEDRKKSGSRKSRRATGLGSWAAENGFVDDRVPPPPLAAASRLTLNT